MTNQNATPQFLLEGAYYALVQCGRLLTSAAILYKARDYATAVGLAALAHEELGRSWYLRDQRRQVVQGKKVVSVEDIRDACKDHVTKQEWGLVGLMRRTQRNSGFGKLLERRHRAEPQSMERCEADQQVEDITERQRDRTPEDRHGQRMRAFYIEPNDAGTDWNKAWEKGQQEAEHFLEEAINDYQLQLHNHWLPGMLKHDDPELAEALEAWTSRPALPPPPHLRGDNTMDVVDHHELHAIGRLLFRSALLGSMMPVYGLQGVSQGEFWTGKAIQVVFALILCLLLYGLEKAIHWLSQNRLRVKPIYAAAYRGGILYGLLIYAESPADVAGALGAALGGSLVAMGLFKLEELIIRKIGKRHGTSPQETSSAK